MKDLASVNFPALTLSNSFKPWIFWATNLLVFCVFPAMKITDANGHKRVQEGQVAFVSDAPLEYITATSNKLTGILDTSTGQFAFRVPMSSFVGFNSKLQKEHFEENYLEVIKFPNASFTGKIIEKIVYDKNGEYRVRAKGKLNIHGIEKEIILNGIVAVKNKRYTIKSDFTVSLNDFNIPIPQLVKEKIAENIRIKVNVTF